MREVGVHLGVKISPTVSDQIDVIAGLTERSRSGVARDLLSTALADLRDQRSRKHEPLEMKAST